MMFGRIPLASRIFVVGALAVVVGCSSSNPSNPPADTGVSTDLGTPVDASDVPTPPPDNPPPPTDNPPPPTDNPPPPTDVPADVQGMPGMSTRAVVNCGTTCQRPLDAVPDSMGRNVFFTAFTAMGEPAVFRAAIPPAGMPPAAPVLVVAGNGLEFPVGITLTADDQTLYVADQSADRGAEVGIGAIFRIPAAGGMPSSLDLGAELVHPAALSIDMSGDNLLVSAQQRDAMGVVRRALFRVPRTGGSATVLTTNLVDPSGVSQSSTGSIICHDTRRGGARSATAVTVEGATVTPVAGDLVAGYPAGLAYAMTGNAVLFSGADPQNGGGLLTFATGSTSMAPPSLSAGMVTPLGLHRARMMNAWSVADEAAGGTGGEPGSGQVFLVTMNP